MNKKCFKCGKVKSIDEFYTHKRMNDGHLGKCKECTKDDSNRRIKENRQVVRAYEKQRFQNPERKRKAAEYQRSYRMRNPAKYAARNAVNYALRSGRLVRLPCETCGACKTQAHHDDYTKPLDVRWFCFKHHREIPHKQKVG